MYLPNVPTDNLYKFIALAGIVLFILSIFYPEIQRQELRDEIALLNGEIQKLDYEKSPLEEKTKEIKKKIAELDRMCNCGFTSVVNDTVIVRPLITSGPKEIMKLFNTITELIDEKNDLLNQTNLKTLSVNTKNELIENKSNSLAELNDAAEFFLPFSMFLSAFGFVLWFTNTQRYQDSLLKGQYEQFKKHERCQSCGILFINDPNHWDIMKDEQANRRYCSHCYRDGNFTEPSISLLDMKEKVKQRCKELGIPPLVTYIYLLRLKELERWRSKFTWAGDITCTKKTGS